MNAGRRIGSPRRTRSLSLHSMPSGTNNLRRSRPIQFARSRLRNEMRSYYAHIGACVSVTEGQGGWPSTLLIAEVSDTNIVTLFMPKAGSNPQASCIQVDCSELDIVEIPQGSCPLRLHVRRRYDSTVQLGEITRWEDRSLPVGSPKFNKVGTLNSCQC
jgi:hypothetical protein